MSEGEVAKVIKESIPPLRGRKLDESTIGVVGLGYVGLPLAVSLSNHFDVVGFDSLDDRIGQLVQHVDITKEVARSALESATRLELTAEPAVLKKCSIYIVTVPTPVDASSTPDLSSITQASETLAKFMSEGDIVIYESTVYPGLTEEICVPILATNSGLEYNTQFFCGYSPERMNPGDKTRTLQSIVKVTAGSTPEVATLVDDLYSKVVTAGTFKVESIKIAEAAKIIENTQRDLNIALINELAQLFKKLGIDTQKVLEAANTKWNFHSYSPGLVGGHCIGVDPYYLVHKAQEIGFATQVILAGRSTNDGMAKYVASEVKRLMDVSDTPSANGDVLVLGLTFKENCSDTRNSQAISLCCSLVEHGFNVSASDPFVTSNDLQFKYPSIRFCEHPFGEPSEYAAVIVAVAHDEYRKKGVEAFKDLLSERGLLFDLKWVFREGDADWRM